MPRAMRTQLFGRSSLPRAAARPARLRTRAPQRVYSKLYLEPCGDGKAEHLGGGDFKVAPRIELSNGLFEVGRADPADIVIPVPSVSGRHAMLRVDDARVTVTDLRSTNGTYVDGNEINAMMAYEVLPGSTVIFGDEHLAMFELRVGEESSASVESPASEPVSEPAPKPVDA